MPGPEELSRAELLALLSAKDEQIDALVRVGKLTAQVKALVLKPGKDSATSSKPPSSDGPDRRPRGGSSRTRSGRKPGKQVGEPGTALCQVDDPDEVIPIQASRRVARDTTGGGPVMGYVAVRPMTWRRCRPRW